MILNKKILIFTAHPDDHLTCAGTLMFFKSRDFEIKEIVATGGEMGPWWINKKEQKKNFSKEELKEKRKNEIKKASALIGISETIFLGMKDSQVTRDFEVIEKIIEIIRKERPLIVFLPNKKDYHCDHREFSKIVLEAIEKASWNYLLEKGKPWRVPIVLMWEGFYLERADIVFDVSDFSQKKKKLIKIYSSQINPKEEKLLESMNYYRAFSLRKEKSFLAEAFEIPENFPLDFISIFKILS
jgi:LmbE family N-acetylglucosaminyl deacetylase